MNYIVCAVLMLILCLGCKAGDSCFENCGTKANEMLCLKCCNDLYDNQVSQIQNKATSVTQIWIKRNLPGQSCVTEPSKNSANLSSELHNQLARGSNDSVWSMRQDDNFVYVKPDLSRGNQQDQKEAITAKSNEILGNSLKFLKSEITKIANKKNRACKKECWDKWYDKK